MSTERQNVKHWRIKEDKGGWWLLGYHEGSAGIFHVRGRIFGMFLARDICEHLLAAESGAVEARA